MTPSTSLLATDGYKFSMAEAGWPLRVETFYYTHRRGGAQLLPVDVDALVRRMLPAPTADDYGYLAAHEYEMGAGFKAAMVDGAQLRIDALPKGSWFLPREPVFTVTGPSALVSWLEPLALMINWRIQVATLAATDPAALERELRVVTCGAQREVALETLDAIGARAPRTVEVDEAGYAARVTERARQLAALVGDPGRLFEVGLRAASTLEQHRVALAACRDAGVRRTSNVLGARELGMVPVGTMGHEHVQRYASDDAAFRAMRERRPQRSSYLLDTFDTVRSGIPAAFRLMEEAASQGDSIRFDSGDKEAQYRFAVAEARRRGLRPVMILEDGFDADLTRRFEAVREEVGWRPEEQFYGYGGHLVAGPTGSALTRDRVAAVYKLSQSGRAATMKFGDEPGSAKESFPGRPVVFRRDRAATAAAGASGRAPLGLVGQEGEPVPQGYVRPSRAGGEPCLRARGASGDDLVVGVTEATRALADELRRRRAACLCGETP